MMDTVKWTGFILVSLGSLLFSLFHVVITSTSKISLAGALEGKEKFVREKILQDFDRTRLAVELARSFFLIGFTAFLFILLPGSLFKPALVFIVALTSYLVAFDLLPRFINYLAKPLIINLFLLFLPLLKAVTLPATFFLIKLEKKEAEREEKEDDREASDEEIETFLDEATEEGIIDKEEEDLMRSVVEFGDTVVREIMTPRVNIVCIKREATTGELKELILREQYSRIPVYRGRLDNIEGLVIAKDIIEYADEKYKSQPIDALIRPVLFVPESMLVSKLLRDLQKAKQKMAIVVDEHGGTSGLVTMEDVIEEIVGEIHDEYDHEETTITATGIDDYIVSGATEAEELEELFDVELTEDDFITVSGLIARYLGRFPEKGEKVIIKGLEFEVLDVDMKSIKKLRVRRP